MSKRDFLYGVAVGAAVAYIADPQAGRRRRAVARDQFVRAGRKTRKALDATARDVANRTSGILAATRGRLSRAGVDDRRLAERVRAKLGRVSSNPHAIDVVAEEGVVTLCGPILATEFDDVMTTVWAVPGVLALNNELDVYTSPEGIPSLQGEGQAARLSLDIMRPRWAPATQAFVAAAGLGLAAAAALRYAHEDDLSGLEMRATSSQRCVPLSIVAAGCDDSTPTGPTNGAVLSNFANTTPDGIRGQQRDTLGRPDLTGRYEITLTAAPACSQLPSPLRSLTLTGLVSPTGDWWPHDRPFIERVGPDAFLMLVGTVRAPELTTPAPFTAAFDGTISFCSAMTPPSGDIFPTTCAAPVECRSDRHQIRFVRR